MLDNTEQESLKNKLDSMELSAIKTNLSQQVYGPSSSPKARFVTQYIEEKERQTNTEIATKNIKLAEEANTISMMTQKETRRSNIVSMLALIVSMLALIVTIIALAHKW